LKFLKTNPLVQEFQIGGTSQNTTDAIRPLACEAFHRIKDACRGRKPERPQNGVKNVSKPLIRPENPTWSRSRRLHSRSIWGDGAVSLG
jgi:hypothetical protein